MSDIALKNGRWLVPFWGAEHRFIAGQDMLGMQVASESTYSALLPGLTNLTQRIRYYGLFVWLIEQYALRTPIDSTAEFNRFVRRGELLFAFIMADSLPYETAVVGSRFAARRLEGAPGTIDLKAGADQAPGNETYWKFASGAFGQYYQGAMSAIGLIRPSNVNSRILVCTERGRLLASHFQENLAPHLMEKFLTSISLGEVQTNELEEMSASFNLTSMPDDSSERRFYIELLFGEDIPFGIPGHKPTFFRKDSILLFMSYLQQDDWIIPDEDFPRAQLLRLISDGGPATDGATLGWQFYALNETGHYCMETWLWGLLLRIQREGPASLQKILKDFVADILSSLHKISDVEKFDENISFSKWILGLTRNEGPYFHIDFIDTSDGGQASMCAAHALCALGVLLKDAGWVRFPTRYSRSGDVLELLRWMDSHAALPLQDFMEKLILRHVVNRHLETAMRKMRGRNDNTLKFQIEDDRISFIGIALPKWTGPRLTTVTRFLRDLSLVDEYSRPTPDGERVQGAYA